MAEEKTTPEQKPEKKKKEKKGKLLYPANKKGNHIIPFMNFLRIVCYPIHYLFYPFKMHGHKKVGQGAYIYFGNHLCMWDPFYPAHTTWEGIHFLCKESIVRAPFVGFCTRKASVIPVARDGSDARSVMDCMRVLKNGEKISLFPEGTRNKVSEEEFLPFRGGASMLAIKTRTPVIPFVICNRPRVFRMTHVVFGEPMELSEYYDRKLTQEDYAAADEKLKNRLYELRAEFRAQQAAKKKK